MRTTLRQTTSRRRRFFLVAAAVLVAAIGWPFGPAVSSDLPADPKELERVATEAAQRLMDQLDLNRDGFIDMEDAELAIARGRGQADELAVQGAMRYDLDGDGVITEVEIRGFARRYFDLQADKDGHMAGTGQTFESYVSPLIAQFHKWDLDGDGKVTGEEVRRYLSSEDANRDRVVREDYADRLHTLGSGGKTRLSVGDIKDAFIRAATTPIPAPPPPATPSSGVGLDIDRFVTMQATAILKEFGPDAAGRVSREKAVEVGGTTCYLLSMDEEGEGFVDRRKIERRARAAAKAADVDKDGMLSQTEMLDAWAMLHGMKTWKLPDEKALPAK